MADEIDQVSKMEEGQSKSVSSHLWSSAETVKLLQKIFAEIVGTYFVIFAGCGSVAINKLYGETITFPGVSVVWGLIVMVMVYSVGHISGAHFNPAVTITFAIFRKFPPKHLLGSIMASGTLCLLFQVPEEAFFGTVPIGPNVRSFFLEIIISFLLMFVISGVSTDNRAVGELAGIAVGMTITLNVFVAGPVSGASMNPARSLGPAVVMRIYKGIWVYILGPPIGTILGGFAYNLIRYTNKPLSELTKSATLMRSVRG
ncbi:Probable aquaporin NIP-type [Linum perenne]